MNASRIVKVHKSINEIMIIRTNKYDILLLLKGIIVGIYFLCPQINKVLVQKLQVC